MNRVISSGNENKVNMRQPSDLGKTPSALANVSSKLQHSTLLSVLGWIIKIVSNHTITTTIIWCAIVQLVHYFHKWHIQIRRFNLNE